MPALVSLSLSLWQFSRPSLYFYNSVPSVTLSPFLFTAFSGVAVRVLLRPERVCLLVCRLSSTSRDAVTSSSASFPLTYYHLSFLSSGRLSCRPPYHAFSTPVLRSAFPAGSLSSSSSRSTPCVAAGFPRTPVLTFSLISRDAQSVGRRDGKRQIDH